MTEPQRLQQPPPRPARLLGLDPGERRTGVALSDDLGMFAHPRAAITGLGEPAIAAISDIVSREGVSEIVVGLPLSLSGAESAQTASARKFARELRARLGLRVTEWDERLSSVQAARSVKGAARRGSGELDSAAAAVVLQAFLDARANGVAR